jgi:multiple sugar transport system permease protein
MKMREKLHRDWPAAIFLAPSLLGTALFFFIPFLLVIWYAMVDNPVIMNFVGLGNFINLFQNQAYLQAAGNTMLFSIISLPLVVGLSLVLAMILNGKLKARSQLRSLFLSPLLVPVASIVLVWQVVFSYNGALNTSLADFGFIPVDWLKSDSARFVIIGLYLWKNLGYNMVLFLAALNTVPVELLDSARVDGATPGSASAPSRSSTLPRPCCSPWSFPSSIPSRFSAKPICWPGTILLKCSTCSSIT